MKCKCGNEQGKPIVSPRPWTFRDEKTKQELPVNFMAGFIDGMCWWCRFPGRHLK